jgi:hypothetical protein
MVGGTTLGEQESTNAALEGEQLSSGRTLVLVAGSGRSGTSLFTGILQRLGFHVPQPEVPADETNPRGFAESQWVVDFHTRLLKKAAVQVSDARPTAWARVAELTLDSQLGEELRTWLGAQFKEADHLIVKDPRLSWFLPLWRRCAEELAVSPRCATVLRHPAAVVDSKQRFYGDWQSDVSRTAGWLNQALFTERATRDFPRVFVRYEDLLDDWTSSVARVGNQLQLQLIQDAPAPAIVGVHDFVDLSLSRSRATWDDFEIPSGLREQVDHVWELLSRFVEGETGGPALLEELDVARAAYITLYGDAEAIAQSSIAASWSSAANGSTFLKVAGRVPRPLRNRLPLSWRRAAYRAAHGRGARRPG